MLHDTISVKKQSFVNTETLHNTISMEKCSFAFFLTLLVSLR